MLILPAAARVSRFFHPRGRLSPRIREPARSGRPPISHAGRAAGRPGHRPARTRPAAWRGRCHPGARSRALPPRPVPAPRADATGPAPPGNAQAPRRLPAAGRFGTVRNAPPLHSWGGRAPYAPWPVQARGFPGRLQAAPAPRPSPMPRGAMPGVPFGRAVGGGCGARLPGNGAARRAGLASAVEALGRAASIPQTLPSLPLRRTVTPPGCRGPDRAGGICCRYGRPRRRSARSAVADARFGTAPAGMVRPRLGPGSPEAAQGRAARLAYTRYGAAQAGAGPRPGHRVITRRGMRVDLFQCIAPPCRTRQYPPRSSRLIHPRYVGMAAHALARTAPSCPCQARMRGRLRRCGAFFAPPPGLSGLPGDSPLPCPL